MIIFLKIGGAAAPPAPPPRTPMAMSIKMCDKNVASLRCIETQKNSKLSNDESRIYRCRNYIHRQQNPQDTNR